MRTISGLDELRALVGVDLGSSGWLDIDQQRIEGFAQSTGDHQWIHVDPDRAATGPFGHTIAHGYLTLSLVVPLLWELVSFPADAMIVNYGLNKVRFPAPVAVNSQVRLRATIDDVTDTKNGAELVLGLTVEISGSDRPACVAQAVYRYVA